MAPVAPVVPVAVAVPEAVVPVVPRVERTVAVDEDHAWRDLVTRVVLRSDGDAGVGRVVLGLRAVDRGVVVDRWGVARRGQGVCG